MKTSIIILSTLILGMIISSCKKNFVEESNAEPRLKQARVELIAAESSLQPMHYSGRIAANTSTILSFKIGGIIQQIFVEPGDRVKKGQLLAMLNSTEIDAQVAQAQEQVVKLSRDLDRFEALYQDSAASLENVQNIKTALQIAESQLKIAQFNRKYSAIYAQEDGEVAMKFHEENELISPGEPILSLLSQEAGFLVSFGVTDKEITQLKLGDSAVVLVEALQNQKLLARVSEIAVSPNPNTGLFKIELLLTEDNDNLKEGFFARAQVFPSATQVHYKIPMHALKKSNNNEAVFLVKEKNTASLVRAKVLQVHSDFVMVDFQGKEKLSVITTGSEYLNDGDLFQPLSK